jgi:hypothetical protein
VRTVLLILLVACAEPRSERCKEICSREAECVERIETDQAGGTAFDEGDCVAACAALERDKQTAGLVEAHAVCVAKAASDCRKLLECR